MDAIRNSLEQKTAQLRAVGQISAALAAARKLEDTLEAITRITSQVMGVDSCSIYLQEDGSDRLVLKATTGLAPQAVGRASLGIGQGLTGWAITHAQPVAVRDALNDPRFLLLPETNEEGLHSLMAVPLSVQGRIIGAMNVQTAEMHDFNRDEVELLELIANLAAGALEKAALYDRMQQQIEELSTLAEVSRTVTSPLYLDEMLGVVAEMAARVMGARATTLRLLDEANGQLVLRAAHNAGVVEPPFAAIPVGQGIAGQVAASGQPLVAPNVQTDERYLNRPLAERQGWISLLSVPLIVRRARGGSLLLLHGRLPRVHPQRDRAVPDPGLPDCPCHRERPPGHQLGRGARDAPPGEEQPADHRHAAALADERRRRSARRRRPG